MSSRRSTATSRRFAAARSAGAARSAVPAREYTSVCGINRAFLAADEAWRAELARTTIAQMVGSALEDAPRAAVQKSARWLSAALPAT